MKSTEHGIKAAAVTALRPWFRTRREPLGRVDAESMTRVLFLRPEKIGDMVISFPVFDALKQRHPHLKISLVASPRSYPLVKDDPRFDRIFIYRKNVNKTFGFLRELRAEGFDCILDMIDADSATTLIMSQYAGRTVPRIGVGKERHDRYYDFNYDHPDGVGGHIIDNTMGLLVPFDVDTEAASGYATPYITRTAARKAGEALAGIEPGLRLGFNLSAGQPNRLWPTEKAQELARRLTALRDDLRLILIVAPSDRERGLAVLSAVPDSARLVPPGLGLLDVCSLISQVDLLISPDTSLIHVARSFQIPVVGLYSDARKNFTRWKPYRQPDGAVVALDDDTIYDISVDQVFDRVTEILQREHPVVS